MNNFDKTVSAWLLCCAAGLNLAGVFEILEGGSPVVGVLFLSLSVAFIAAGSYRMFYPRKVR